MEQIMAKKKRKKGTENIILYVIFGIILVLVIALVIMIVKWNKGQESDYDPDAVTTEFDTEPNDYILPLSAEQVSGKADDGVVTILTLGNSPFADDYGSNNLAKTIGDIYGATVINGGIEGSYITCKNSDYSEDEEQDGVSLPFIAGAVASGDFSVPESAAPLVSEQAVLAVQTLKQTDMSSVDAIFIMYDLEDYVDHRPLGSESETDITCIYGAVRSSIEKLRAAYPYIRVVYLSQPASGKTIDGFFVDGDVHNIGEGLLSDYVTFELSATATAGASFVDIYYGAVNVDQRDEFITNDYHLNDKGAKSVADRVHELIPLQP